MQVVNAAPMPVVDATPMAVAAPPMQAMNLIVPDGVAPGGQFTASTPSGQMMVTCPPGVKPGDQIQIMAPAAPAAPMAAPMATAASTPQIALHPAAVGMDGSIWEGQGSICVLPQPIRKDGKDSVLNPDLGPRGSTGSPDVTHRFVAPNIQGIVPEADFDAALLKTGLAGQPDPFASYLSGGRELVLDVDVDGRIAEAMDRLKSNCCCYIACLAVPLVGCCQIGCRYIGNGPKLIGSFSENEFTQALRDSISSRSMYLTSDAIVYECAAHTTEVIQNVAGFDQYGHRFPAAVATKVNVPATKFSIPLGRAEVIVTPSKDVIAWAPFTEEMAAWCYKPSAGHVVTVRVGDGIKTVVACIETGKGSNAAAFAEKCNRAAASAPAESPELTAAFNAWMLDRLRLTGTMTGGGPKPQAMARQKAAPFVKSVGPLPDNLGVEKNRFQRNKLKGLNELEITKDGYLYKPRSSTCFTQLNAGDKVVSLNGVPLQGRADHAWLDRAVAAGSAMPPGQPKYMQVVSTMPYFQPNQLLTVSLPPGCTVDQLGLDAGGQKPPKLAGRPVSQLAQSLGCQPGDVIVQATADGAVHDTTRMTASDFIAALSGATTVQLTLLQPALTTDAQHKISWPTSL